MPILQELTSDLGGLLTIGIIVFCALAMPLGIYKVLQDVHKQQQGK